MKRFFAFSAWLLFAGCATPLAQTPPSGDAVQVAAPGIESGARWTYRVRNGFTGLPLPTERYRVTEAGGERIAVTVSREGANDEIQVYDRQWNWLKHPVTNQQMFDYSPAYPAYEFPLVAGRAWNTRLMATDPANGQRFPLTVDGLVEGWERVKVPAGEFNALKVRRFAYLDYYEPNVRGRSAIYEIEWYAPEVKQAVRREARSRYLSFLYGENPSDILQVRGGRDRGGSPKMVQDDWIIYELVDYSVR